MPIGKDHIGKKVQVAYIDNKVRESCLDGLNISSVNLQMHWSIGAKPCRVNLLKRDEIDLKSHERMLS